MSYLVWSKVETKIKEGLEMTSNFKNYEASENKSLIRITLCKRQRIVILEVKNNVVKFQSQQCRLEAGLRNEGYGGWGWNGYNYLGYPMMNEKVEEYENQADYGRGKSHTICTRRGRSPSRNRRGRSPSRSFHGRSKSRRRMQSYGKSRGEEQAFFRKVRGEQYFSKTVNDVS